MAPSHFCHNLVFTLLSKMFTLPSLIFTLNLYRINNFHFLATTKQHVECFHLSPPNFLLYPSSSSCPVDIKYYEMLGICITFLLISMQPVLISICQLARSGFFIVIFLLKIQVYVNYEKERCIFYEVLMLLLMFLCKAQDRSIKWKPKKIWVIFIRSKIKFLCKFCFI